MSASVTSPAQSGASPGFLGSLFSPSVVCNGPATTAAVCPGGITNDPSTWPGGDVLWNVAQAIAWAEGANVAGSAPDRFNNPGDLSKGDEHGQNVSGYTTLPDGENLIIFVTKTDGWTALYTKLQAIDRGTSSVYSGDESWYQIGQSYAGNSATWAENVASQLGVDPNSTFNAYVDGTGCGSSGCCSTVCG